MNETLRLEVLDLLTEAENFLASGNTTAASEKISEAKDKFKLPPALPGTGSNGGL